MDEVKYLVALSVLNGLVGIRFAALKAALGDVTFPHPPHNESQIDQLRKEFQESCDLRDQLPSAGIDDLQRVIDQYGPIVRQGSAA